MKTNTRTPQEHGCINWICCHTCVSQKVGEEMKDPFPQDSKKALPMLYFRLISRTEGEYVSVFQAT